MVAQPHLPRVRALQGWVVIDVERLEGEVISLCGANRVCEAMKTGLLLAGLRINFNHRAPLAGFITPCVAVWDRSGSIFQQGCTGPRKRKGKEISGVYWRVCHQNEMSRGFSTVYSSTTNDFRYTHRSTDYRPITRSTAGRGCHVSLCWAALCPASCSLLFM